MANWPFHGEANIDIKLHLWFLTFIYGHPPHIRYGSIAND
jgi:hypothetical protein